jgi:hypothetical protein
MLAQDAQAPPATLRGPEYATKTPEELQQLVAPIALYPDSLVAQILSAATFPEQVVEADRWTQAHPDLKSEALAQAVDQMNWDPSVKALTAFPSVLGNMDKNISWTSALGDAYYNQQQDVMDAVQAMRQKAQQAGNLKTTPQQVVTTQGSTIIIQPAAPDVVYVPAYNPWIVYGPPIVAWPGWYPYPGIWYAGPYLSFGYGFGIGFLGGFGWGWPHWGFDWHNRYVVYHNDGTTRIARPFTTAMRITAEGMADRKRLAGAWTGRPKPGGMFSTAPAPRRDRSRETIARRAGTPHRVARAICAPAPLAITITAERREATRREVARVLAVEAFMAAEHHTEAAAHIINLRRGALGARAGIGKGGEPYAVREGKRQGVSTGYFREICGGGAAARGSGRNFFHGPAKRPEDVFLGGGSGQGAL